MTDALEFRIEGPMITHGTGAWGADEAARVADSQAKIAEAVHGPDKVLFHGWLESRTKLGLEVEFHLNSRRVAASDLDNLLNALFNTLVEAAGFVRPKGKPIPQTKDALFWHVDADKVPDEEEHTVVRVWPL